MQEKQENFDLQIISLIAEIICFYFKQLGGSGGLDMGNDALKPIFSNKENIKSAEESQRFFPLTPFLRIFSVLFPLISFFLILCGNAFAEIPEYIKDQLHRDIKYMVITERNTDWIKNLKPGSKPVHFVVVQTKPDGLKEEEYEKIMDWVNAGGVVWFYDSRLAEHFGMKNSPYDRDKIKGQTHKGDYGNSKVDGMNVIVSSLPFADHEVVTGVKNIQVFLIEIEKDKFSAVASDTPGVIPLFAPNIEKKCVVAMKKVGNGWVVFKPLLWPEVLGGERFQVNLKEFSAGYHAPKSEKAVIPSEAYSGKSVKLPRYDSFILTDGNQYLGMVLDKKFIFMGGEGKMNKTVDQIESITIQPTGDSIKLRDGSEYTGTLMTLTVELKTTTGKKVKVEKDKLQSIHFDIGEK